MKPWPTPALSIEQEGLYLTELNPLGSSETQLQMSKVGFSEQPSVSSVLAHRKELVGASSYPALIFRPGNLIYVRGDLVI